MLLGVADEVEVELRDTVERSIAYAYLPAERAAVGQPVEVEIFGDWIAGAVAEEPLWDPAGERIRL